MKTSKENEMKMYEVEYKRTSYITQTVEANNPEEAEAKAWKRVEEDYYINDALWEVESIEEVEGAAK